MTLQKISKHTSHDHERSDPFASPPWKRTTSTFKDRFIVNPCSTSPDTISARELHLNNIADLQKDPNTLYLYSDGSKINKSGFFRIGTAAVAYYMGNEVETGRLGLAEVFDAEMAALSLSTTKAANIINDFPNITNVHFFTDNAASITAIADPKPGPAQYFTLKFHHTLGPLMESNSNLHVRVSWCPSHCDYPG